MLLTIDVGNTQTVLGIFDGEELTEHWRMSSVEDRTSDEWAMLVGNVLQMAGLSFSKQVTGVAISSGVPRVTQALKEMTERYFYFKPIVVEPGIRTGMPILYDNPKEVGADRIADAVAAFTFYGGPAIVIDFGTATVFDAISEKGEYLGGSICPGLQVSAAALFAAAAGLRRVEYVAPHSVVGRSTTESLQSGIVFGAVGLVEGMVDRIQDELGGDAVTIATGGLAEIVLDHTDVVDHHEPWLTLHGLRLIYDRNTE
ncbi:MAG: type III pantothenate kinase [Acidimicrobiia bacterium]|nr:type III pantothenate kinase [Acidimicrobiia bacterium]